MPPELLTSDDRMDLLFLARQAIECAVQKQPLPALNYIALPQVFKDMGASFVTLTQNKALRGCIGTLETYQPLVDDVREHAVAAALNDYRFPPLTKNELDTTIIEISRLTQPEKLEYENYKDLQQKLRPQIDGVVLRDGMRKATFLPQVWEKIIEPGEFLDQLCMKLGAEPNYWRKKKLDVLIYQVEEFQEP